MFALLILNQQREHSSQHNSQ